MFCFTHRNLVMLQGFRQRAMILTRAANRSTLFFAKEHGASWQLKKYVPSSDSIHLLYIFRQGKWLSAGICYNCRVTNAGTLVPTWAARCPTHYYNLIVMLNDQILSGSRKECHDMTDVDRKDYVLRTRFPRHLVMVTTCCVFQMS